MFLSSPTTKPLPIRPKVQLKFAHNIPLSKVILRGCLCSTHQKTLETQYQEKKCLLPIVLQKHPIDKEKFFVVAGEQRCFFAKQKGFSHIPVYVISNIERDMQPLLLMLGDLYPILHCLEQAYLFHILLSLPSFTQEELASFLFVGRSTIARILKLTELPHIIQQDLFHNKISVSLAKEFSTIAKTSLCITLYAQHQKQSFTVSQLRQKIKSSQQVIQPKNTISPPPIPSVPSVIDLQNWCSKYFEHTCIISQKNERINIELEFASVEMLQQWIQKHNNR